MSTLLVILAVVVSYFAVGGLVATLYLPRIWVRVEGRVPVDSDRQMVLFIASMTVVFWPVAGPVQWLSTVVDRTKPSAIAERRREQQRQLADRDRTIRELERELGL